MLRMEHPLFYDDSMMTLWSDGQLRKVVVSLSLEGLVTCCLSPGSEPVVSRRARNLLSHARRARNLLSLAVAEGGDVGGAALLLLARGRPQDGYPQPKPKPRDLRPETRDLSDQGARGCKKNLFFVYESILGDIRLRVGPRIEHLLSL